MLLFCFSVRLTLITKSLLECNSAMQHNIVYYIFILQFNILLVVYSISTIILK